jgi:metal-responsive CopG/Arc/MetJ family transcriptional regulator
MAVKLKLSVTLSEDLVSRLDRESRRRGTTRSATLEGWLRGAARQSAEREIEEATVRYYESLTEGERRDDEQLARGLSRAARRVKIDAPARGRAR